MDTVSLEVIYRGVFQRTLASNICRGIVLAARKEGKIGTAFGRYGDSPERNGIPAKQFAVVAGDEAKLEASLASYQLSQVDVTIVLDDTLCKGAESWAWNGLEPVNKLLKGNGTLLITSTRPPMDLLVNIHRRDVPYALALINTTTSFSGLWVYKDDHTDVKILGALARVAPQLVGLTAIEQAILEKWHDGSKVASARLAHAEVASHQVEPGEGNPDEPFGFQLPDWRDMEEALVVRGVAQGGSELSRNPHFKKYTSRTMRPVVDFERCTRCTLCWLSCPDTAFDVTPDLLYDVHLNACNGCALCEGVCPLKGCIIMADEALFADNASQYEQWKRDASAYRRWFDDLLAQAKATPRSHGLHHWGQYRENPAKDGQDMS